MNILNFIYSRKYEGIYCKTRILGICITTKPKRIPKRYIDKIIKREFEIIKNKNYEEKDKKLAVLIAAGIGDYFLFRPFLQHIREYYKDYNITLIVAILSGDYKDIIMEFDSELIDEIILFKILNNKNVYNKVQIAFSNIKYDILISHFYGRGGHFDDLVQIINSNKKIGSFGSLWHTSQYKRATSSYYYDEIIYNKIDEDETVHELDRNKNFFEQVLNKKIEINTVNIKLKDEYFAKIDFNFNDKYCILFPFTSDSGRYYNINNFIKIAQHLYYKYNIISYIVGSKNDIKNTDKIINNFNEKFIKNICGEYKLNELFYIFNKARLIISIDSAGYHIGVHTNKNVICISCGQSYHRYLKYSDNYVKDKNINIILPKELEIDMKNNTTKIGFEYCPMYDINSISTDYVVNLIDEKYNLT